MKKLVLAALLVLLPTLAHAAFTVDSNSALHFGISVGIGFTTNSLMIAAEGRDADKDRVRPWVAFIACNIPGAIKEEVIDTKRDLGDYTFNLLGCGLSVWGSEKLWITV
jgi:hypothetical protein